MKTRWLVGLGVAILVVLLVVMACNSSRADDDVSDDDMLPPSDDDHSGGDDDTGGGDDDATDDDAGDDDTGPSACQGDSAPHSVNYTTWDQLPDITKTFLIDALQDTQVAQDFFGRFVYWYGVMRESSRALRDYYAPTYPGKRWDEEVLAAQLAVAYIRVRSELLNQGMLLQEATELYDAIPNPVPPFSNPETYFNNHEQEITTDPQEYLWYEIYWAKTAMEDQNLAGYANLLVEHVCGNIDIYATFPPAAPFTNFSDPNLGQIVFATYNSELSVWDLHFDPQLKVKQKANIGLVDYE